METQENEFVERLKAELQTPQPRFEIHDPRYDARYKFDTSSEAIAKASEIGATSFQSISGDKSARISQNQFDGEWYQVERDPRNLMKENQVESLSNIQSKIDKEALLGMEIRAEQRALDGSDDVKVDKLMAAVDLAALKRIDDPAIKQNAIEQMAQISTEYPAYKETIENTAPPALKEQIAASIAARVETDKPEKAKEKEPEEITRTQQVANNKVESDEILTASQPDVRPIIPPEIEKNFLRVGDKFYHQKNPDKLAFEDKGNKLETESNSEQIAETMIRIAKARGWDEIKVSGSETFRREAWLEAASQGMHVKGYTPNEQDKAMLAKRQSSTEKETEAETKEKKMAKVFASETPQNAVERYPELAGAVALAAAFDKKAEADGLSPEQRAIGAERTRQNIANRIERGDIPEIKIKEEIEVETTRKEEAELSR